MKSEIAKRSVVINGHKTSVSLEDAFWLEVKAIATERNLSLSELVSLVDYERGEVGNLSSALRCFVLSRYYFPAMTAGSQQQAPGYQEPQPARP